MKNRIFEFIKKLRYLTGVSLTYVLLMLVNQSCSVGYVTVPPERLYVSRPPQPYLGSVWIEGDWRWRGGQYVWVDGHWGRPRGGRMYTPGQWGPHRHGGYRWHGGHWR